MSESEIIQHLQEALDKALIGGNHIASNLIGLLGAGKEFPDFHTSFDEARKILASRPEHTVDWMNEYEQWCCWKSCMDARSMAEKALVGYDGEVLGAFK